MAKRKKRKIIYILIHLFPETSSCEKDCKCKDCESKETVSLNRLDNTLRRTCKLIADFMYVFNVN